MGFARGSIESKAWTVKLFAVSAQRRSQKPRSCCSIVDEQRTPLRRSLPGFFLYLNGFQVF
jgi:hypothetical protein